MTQNKNTDVRWKQRFSSFQKALSQMTNAIGLIDAMQPKDVAEIQLMQEGLIQRFEFTHELAWNVMKDYAEYQGFTNIRGFRDAIRKALEMELIVDERWMNTIDDRNISSHNYDQEIAGEIYENIANIYCGLFKSFEIAMLRLL